MSRRSGEAAQLTGRSVQQSAGPESTPEQVATPPQGLGSLTCCPAEAPPTSAHTNKAAAAAAAWFPPQPAAVGAPRTTAMVGRGGTWWDVVGRGGRARGRAAAVPSRLQY